MLESFQSKVPASWDPNFIITKLAALGITNHFGYDIFEGEYRFRVLMDDADSLLSVISTYQTDYLSVVLPKLKTEVSKIRSEKIKNFSFGGLTMELDYITEHRLTSAALGLMRNESVTEVKWDLGGLTFIVIPRADMLALADAAFNYVQGCFSRSKELGELLNAATTVDEATAIDLEAGWPV
jgi:hypothetical protein